MNKNKGMIILSIILAIQLVFPLSVWAYETYKNDELEEKGQEIKLLVDRVHYDEHKIETGNDVLASIAYSNENKFVVFETKENGFEIPVVTDSPETDLYISVNRLYSLYRENWGFVYESETVKAQDEFDFYRLYDKEIESENIRYGLCEGPETQAYVVFKVYKNRLKVVNVYIDGKPVDTVIEEYNSNQYDVERYEYNDYEYYSYDEETEAYTDVTDSDGNYVTEPVAV